MHKVKVTWCLGQDTNAWWDQVCIWAVEEFGLPGDKYKTELTEDYMIFDFKEAEDAMLMKLTWGER
jgi:hypothetical protein